MLTADIREQLCHNPLTQLASVPTAHYISSPLGLVPKHDGEWRRVHDLSYPKNSRVNDHIPHTFGALEYVTFDDAVDALLAAGHRALMVKRDLAEAFRHIPVALSDRWLLGFFWEGLYYQEKFLPFGIRTAPFLSDLFAIALNGILIVVFSWTTLLHYLDDFLTILPAAADISFTKINSMSYVRSLGLW